MILGALTGAAGGATGIAEGDAPAVAPKDSPPLAIEGTEGAEQEEERTMSR